LIPKQVHRHFEMQDSVEELVPSCLLVPLALGWSPTWPTAATECLQLHSVFRMLEWLVAVSGTILVTWHSAVRFVEWHYR